MNNVFQRSITHKLVILFFAVGVSCLAVTGIYSYYSAKKAILSRTLDQLTSIRVIKKRLIQTYFEDRYKYLEFIAQTDRLISLAQYLREDGSSSPIRRNRASEYFAYLEEKIDFRIYGFSHFYIISPRLGEKPAIWEAVDSLILPFRGDQVTENMLFQFFRDNNGNDPLIGDFVKRFDSDTEPVCLMAIEIDTGDKGPGSILALQVPIQSINDIMLEDHAESGLGNSGEIYLVGPDSLMRSNSRFIMNSVLNTKVNTTSVRNSFKDQVGSSLIDDYRTIAVLSSYDRLNIPGLNWVILSEIDYEEAMIPIVSIRNDIAFLSLIICVLLFSIAHIISRTITQPIIRLQSAAKQIGEGKFDISMKPSTNDEIGLLTETFMVMSNQLREERQKRMMALYDGQEMERQRISRELHDGLGQKLVALKLRLEGTSKLSDPDARRIIDSARADFISLIDEVRQISSNLAPIVLKESGLDVALRILCTTTMASVPIDIEFSTYGDVAFRDSNTKTYIYRIVQEALNNAVKHAETDKIEIQLMGNAEFIIIVIGDRGKGFTQDKDQSDLGNGIYNMMERAKLLGGSLEIESEPGKGTTILLKIPKQVRYGQD